MSDFQELTRKIIEFRDARDWKQFHNPKDAAVSLSLETAEVLEHFQWKNGDDLNSYVKENKEAIGEELADVLYWILLMSNDMGIDIKDISEKKLMKNAEKYPVEKAKGKTDKYTNL